VPMTRQWSIASLMLLVAAFAVASSAYRNATTPRWIATATLVVLIILTAMVGTLINSGRDRTA